MTPKSQVVIVGIMMVVTTMNAQPNASILDINYKNPTKSVPHFPANIWPKRVCGDAVWIPGTAPREWESILDADKNSGNNEIVGVAGNVFNPHTSGADVWFTHPFGFDYNFDIQWKADSNFDFLVSPRIKPDEEEDGARINALQHGFNGDIHVEMDSGFVPPAYRAKPGNTAAVFGRWIVDCGHDNYQSEIHPPLLFIKAAPRLAIGGSFETDATVISRPFMVSQDFGNEGSLMNHIVAESHELIASEFTGPFAALFQFTAIPNILKKSFTGTHLMSFNIRPPRKPKLNEHLFLSYHLTVRSGVAVTAVPIDDGLGTITVSVLLDETTYSYPQLPPPITESISFETLKQFDDRLSKALWVSQFAAPANPFVAIVLNKGVKTQRYEIPVYSEPADVTVSMNELRANNQVGITVDDNQVYPVRGSLHVFWKVVNVPPVTPCSLNPSKLASDHSVISFSSSNASKAQLITITNPTNAPIQLGKLEMTGTNADKFQLLSSTPVIVRHGMPQPPETCSNTTLPASGSCKLRIVMSPNSGGVNLSAVLDVPGGGPCPLQIPVRKVKG